MTNLWVLGNRLSPYQRKLARRVISALLNDDVMPSDLTRALLVSGEQRRYMRTGPSAEWERRFLGLEQQVEELCRVIPPCFNHSRAAKLLESFREVRDELFDSETEAADEPNF